MKKKLLLDTVLKLKTDVERSIEATFNDAIKYNTTEKNIDALLLRLERLEAQLIIFKETIQEANKGKLGGVTNNYNIYLLSNYKSRIKFYEGMEKILVRSTRKAENAQIKLDDVRFQKALYVERAQELSDKLTLFNSKKKVTVFIDDSLNLL
jgi:hypothetical protein